jgi:hypothetical protein
MSLKVGDESVDQKISEAQSAYETAIENYKGAKFALQEWDRWPHDEMSDEERIWQRSQLAYLKDEAQAALTEASQLYSWMVKEVSILSEHSPHRQGSQ